MGTTARVFPAVCFNKGMLQTAIYCPVTTVEFVVKV